MASLCIAAGFLGGSSSIKVADIRVRSFVMVIFVQDDIELLPGFAHAVVSILSIATICSDVAAVRDAAEEMEQLSVFGGRNRVRNNAAGSVGHALAKLYIWSRWQRRRSGFPLLANSWTGFENGIANGIRILVDAVRICTHNALGVAAKVREFADFIVIDSRHQACSC